MIIDIFREGTIRFPYRGIKKREISAMAEKVCALLELEDSRIAVILTDNGAIRAINKRYRKKDRPTDVISFANRDRPFPSGGGEEELGDVYLSLEQAWLQHGDFSSSFRDEVKRLLVHGILHLLGYDHERSSREEARMRRKEEELLGRM